MFRSSRSPLLFAMQQRLVHSKSLGPHIGSQTTIEAKLIAANMGLEQFIDSKIKRAAKLEVTSSSHISVRQELFSLYTELSGICSEIKLNDDADRWLWKIDGLEHLDLHAPAYADYCQLAQFYQRNKDRSSQYMLLNFFLKSSYRTWWYDDYPLKALEELAYAPTYNHSALLYLGLGHFNRHETSPAETAYKTAISRYNSLDALVMLRDLYAAQHKISKASMLDIKIKSMSVRDNLILPKETPISKYHEFYTLKPQPNKSIQELKNLGAKQLDGYILSLDLESLSLYLCGQTEIIEQAISFIIHVRDQKGQRVFDFFTFDPDSDFDKDSSHILKAEIERFQCGLCLGLSALFLMCASIKDNKTASMHLDDLYWFYRCIILLRLPHNRLSIEQQQEVTRFISFVVHLQNSSTYFLVANDEKSDIIQAEIKGITTHIFNSNSTPKSQFQHIDKIEFTGQHSFLFSDNTFIPLDLAHSTQLWEIVNQAGPLYLSFMLRSKSYAHAVALYRDPSSNFTYYDPNYGSLKVKINNAMDLENFKQDYLMHFFNNYRVRFNPRDPIEKATGNLSFKVGKATAIPRFRPA